LIARDLFVQHVREALAHLHNPARLETSPLADLLTTGQPPGLSVEQALRQVLREAIEALRPGSEVPPDRPEWLGYHLLQQRYVQAISQVMSCERLGLSRATYYRRHQELTEAVAGVLWSQYQRQQPAVVVPVNGEAELSPDERARKEAVRLARAGQPSLLDSDVVLQGAVETIQPFARQQGVELHVQVPAALPAIYGDPGAFRQIILNVLTEGIILAAESSLNLLVSRGEREMCWQLRGLDRAKLGRRAPDEVPGFAVSRALLEVYGGRLWLDEAEPERPILRFAIPDSRPQSVLVIDDDADTVNLYRRYLEIHGYVLQAAP
jgi:CheY-like chemotaxis protein